MRRVGLSFLFVLFLALTGSAQTPGQQRDSLRDLPGFRVTIENFDEKDSALQGVSRSQIQNDVELRLRKAGIRVLTEKEWLNSLNAPTLYVNINLMTSSAGLYAYDVSVDIQQEVILKTSPSRTTIATTWDKAMVGALGSRNLGDLRNSVNDLVDFFINDYLAANPKP